MFRQYDPQRVKFVFRGVEVSGYMDGTFIEAERSEEVYSTLVGATGGVARTRNRNMTGKITLTLMAVSPSNDLLADILDQDEQHNTGWGPILIEDLNGNMQCRAKEAWIAKMPKIERAKEAGSVVWEFECAELLIRPRGNVEEPTT